MGPGEEWIESKGTARRELIFDGRFVVEHVDAEGMGEGRFRGLGIVGFNTIDNRFESVRIENMATYVSTSSGTYDERTKSFTFEGEMIDPMTGNRMRTRMTMDCSEPDREVATGWTVLPDGTLEKTFEGVFERKHSRARARTPGSRRPARRRARRRGPAGITARAGRARYRSGAADRPRGRRTPAAPAPGGRLSCPARSPRS